MNQPAQLLATAFPSLTAGFVPTPSRGGQLFKQYVMNHNTFTSSGSNQKASRVDAFPKIHDS
ncbi:MAG: hypothetical protein ACI87E_005133, partial [Mariniblastus sp.]